MQATTDRGGWSLVAWVWAIAVSIVPMAPFAFVYGAFGLSIVAQTAVLLFSARRWIRPGRPDRNFIAVGLISAANGMPIFFIWQWLQICSGACLQDSVPRFFGIFALLGGLMLVALTPLAVVKSRSLSVTNETPQ